GTERAEGEPAERGIPPDEMRDSPRALIRTANHASNADPVTTAARVLVVDDDATVAEVATRYLAREGYRVEAVADGNDALRRATEDPPDIVVLDLMLPGLDGLEVCRRLRATTPVPIIMLTARGDESDRVIG